MDNLDYFPMIILLGLIVFIITQFAGIFNSISTILIVVTSFCFILLTGYIYKHDLGLKHSRTYLFLVIFFLVILGVIAGYAINNGNSGYDLVDINSMSNSTSVNYTIVVDYDGPYTAGYGTEFSNYDFTSNGPTEFSVGNTSFINVGAKKSDGSNRKLTLSIMRGDKVIEEESTTAPYGEVKINFNG